MSRITNIDGLHIITDKDVPFIFKHGQDGNDSQTTRDIHNEYIRLRGHILQTITKKASSSAHSADIETDSVIPESDYLVLTEMWLRDNCDPVPVNIYECISRQNNRSDSDANAAGGVAIYRKLSSTSMAEVLQVALSDTTRATGCHI
ncbi:hypothetical protein EVAR_53522_1 [Eumeta japonica]|uniref:Uncharacterized protein n=1 Tax=Eumeta variegata TaxID=151549 RepID=A0A4C1Y4M0_EUMVA|nr:hypothetical protein EVAR_53522_1 [Eumeta japonica]